MARSDIKRGPAVTVSVVVLAYNEAGNLKKTVASIRETISGRFADYEIIIVDDGSRDGTGRLANEIAARDPRVIALHNPGNRGCGYTFMRGVRVAKYQYVWLIPGDGEIGREAMAAIASHAGEADMVIPYVTNFESRPLERRIISWGYTAFINTLFWKKLHYYNGPCLLPAAPVKSLPTVSSRGFAFMAPIILRLLKRGYSGVEVGISLSPRACGQPSVGSLRNILSAMWTVLRLLPDIYFREKRVERIAAVA